LIADAKAQPPSTLVLDVNLLGPLYFARIAAVYLRHNAQTTDDKSIILLSSAAGFLGTPGLATYSVRCPSLSLTFYPKELVTGPGLVH